MLLNNRSNPSTYFHFFQEQKRICQLAFQIPLGVRNFHNQTSSSVPNPRFQGNPLDTIVRLADIFLFAFFSLKVWHSHESDLFHEGHYRVNFSSYRTDSRFVFITVKMLIPYHRTNYYRRVIRFLLLLFHMTECSYYQIVLIPNIDNTE